MRPKVDQNKKRGIMIGVKVDKLTKAKIDYIADASGETTSTYIYSTLSQIKSTNIQEIQKSNGRKN